VRWSPRASTSLTSHSLSVTIPGQADGFQDTTSYSPPPTLLATHLSLWSWLPSLLTPTHRRDPGQSTVLKLPSLGCSFSSSFSIQP
jgi:hypothetical protein